MSVKHLYIHIPFCHRICPYCNFYKHTPGKTQNRAFVEALVRELDRRVSELGDRFAPTTVYLGGGTPTLLSGSHLDFLLGAVADRVDTTRLLEWTIEANPATFDAKKAALLVRRGVTRASLGVQSWDPAVLETLGRDHSPADARTGFEVLRDSGLRSVNVDLMFSVPGQSNDSWRATLAATAELQPDHVSAYNLTYEEDTAFFERLRAGEFEPDEDTDGEHFDTAIEVLESAGFVHYETSNFARPGHESLHNWGYWRGEDYLGLGPGAVSTVGVSRWTNLEDTAAYTRRVLAGTPVSTKAESLSGDDIAFERIALLLRTRSGLPLDRLGDDLRERVRDLVEAGLAAERDGHVVLIGRGKHLVDPAVLHLVD